MLDGAGHGPPMRDPVVVNRELDRFVERVAGAPGIRGARRGAGRGRCAGSARCSCLSSPIGLGHTRRDLAIVEALRAEHPDVRVDGWPRTR